MTSTKLKVLVLGGGPDAERDVSLNSAAGVAKGLTDGGTFEVISQTIERIGLPELRTLPGDVIFPVLHGSFGEGGPLQDILELSGRPYVGCKSSAARLAMDKFATKLAAARAGIPTAAAAVFNAKDDTCPLPLPVVLKPIHDGSSVGLHICHTETDWHTARKAAILDISSQDRAGKPGRAYLVEQFIKGQELTCGVIDGEALPLIHIQPSKGPYDYEAKYTRGDTQYTVAPELPRGVTQTVQDRAVALFQALGCRHLSRVDFLLDHAGNAWLLEINTMPGFTATSLVPKAAAHTGIDMPRLCEKLVKLAIRDGVSAR